MFAYISLGIYNEMCAYISLGIYNEMFAYIPMDMHNEMFAYRRELSNDASQMGFVRQYRKTTIRGKTNHYTRDYTRTIRGEVKA